MDLKVRFTFFFSLFSLALIGLFSVFVYIQVSDRMIKTAQMNLSDHLEHEMLHISERPAAHLSAHPPHKAALYVKIWEGSEVIDSSFPANFDPAQHEGLHQQLTTVHNGKTYRLEGFFDLTETDRYLAALKRVLVLAGLLCALAIVPFGYFLTSFLLKPFRKLASAAGGLTAQQLSFRFSAPSSMDEYGSLKASFNELLGRLEKSFAQIERFAMQASHELRTPIAVLKSQIEVTLRRKRSIEEHEEVLKKLKIQTERLEGLTQRLLTLSDIERAAHAQGTESPLKIGSAIQEICQAVKVAHPGKAPSLDLPKISDEWQWRISPTYFSMLVTNLLDNAIKHARSKVKISVNRGAYSLTLKIEDDGHGIPAEERAHIFEPFYRIAPKESGAPKGHGLGLAIAKACAEACSAQLVVGDSDLGGASFSVSFPC